MSAADMREIYRRYAAGRPDIHGILLPDLLPHDVCGASPAPGRIRVLFVAESPPWAAGRHDIAGPPDCLSPDYPYFYNDHYDAGRRRAGAPLSGSLAENLFTLLGLDGETRRENLALFAGKGCYLVDTIRCVFRKNRKTAIPADLIRVSAREILAREFKALSPDYVVALGKTALAGLREIEPCASALRDAEKITAIGADRREHHLLCLPYPGGRNRRYLDTIESGFRTIRDLLP